MSIGARLRLAVAAKSGAHERRLKQRAVVRLRRRLEREFYRPAYIFPDRGKEVERLIEEAAEQIAVEVNLGRHGKPRRTMCGVEQRQLGRGVRARDQDPQSVRRGFESRHRTTL